MEVETLDDGTELAFGMEVFSSDDEEMTETVKSIRPVGTVKAPTDVLDVPSAGGEPAGAVNEAITQWLKFGTGDSNFAVGYHYDMLHDLERNEAYRLAICEAVQDPDDFVLEIGTGSGLLALIASESKCQHVFTVEGDPTMSTAAKRIVEANGYEKKVTVLSKLSTDVVVGWAADMPCRASVLVAEIFDTPLVGEGVLPSFLDAHARLLEPGARVIPHRGRIFVAAMRSTKLCSMARVEPSIVESIIGGSGVGPYIHPKTSQEPSRVFQCHAGDLMQRGQVELLSDPVEVLTLDFADPQALKAGYEADANVVLTGNGPVDGILMWWTLDMTPSGSVQLTTSPFEAASSDQPPRYHWMQGACVFSSPLELIADQTFNLRTMTRNGGWDLFFDVPELSGLVDVKSVDTVMSEFAYPRVPRPRLLQLSIETRFHFYISDIRKAIHNDDIDKSLAFCLGDGCVGVAAALAVCKRVVVCTWSEEAAIALRNMFSGQMVVSPDKERISIYAPEFNQTAASVAAEALAGKLPNVIVCEPWHHGLAVAGTTWGLEEVALVQREVSKLKSDGAVAADTPVTPRIVLVARAFELPEYYRRRQTVSQVEGFDLSEFNESAPLWRQFDVKRQSLAGWKPGWRSECLASVVSWDGSRHMEACAAVSGPISGPGTVHGVAMWLEDSGEVDRNEHADPLDMPSSGIITLREAVVIPADHAGCQRSTMHLTLQCTSLDDLTCNLQFDSTDQQSDRS